MDQDCSLYLVLHCAYKWASTHSKGAHGQFHQSPDACFLQVGISAGGWLARLALGSVPYHGEQVESALQLVS